MPKITLQNPSSGYSSTALFEENNDLIEEHLNDKVLYRDNPTGFDNAMQNDLDMNSNRILNLPSATQANEPLTYGQWTGATGASTVQFTGTVREEFTATAGQTVFTLTGTSYTVGAANLSVYVNGVLQHPSTYTETSTTVVTLSEGVDAGDKVLLVVNERSVSADTVASSSITYDHGGTDSVQRTLLSKLQETVSVADFGAVGNGSTDDTAAIQAAIDVLGVRGGVVTIPSGFYCVVSSLTIKENVKLRGMGGIQDQDEGNDYTYETYWGSALEVSGTITCNDSSGLQNLALISDGIDGYTVPANDTAANTLVGSFSGVAITPSGTGCEFQDLMILGFASVTPSTPVGNRHHWERVKFDCTAGILEGGGSDVTTVRDCHAWPYLTAELGLSNSVNYRSGTAYQFTGNSDRWLLENCYSFGHETGFHIEGSSGNVGLYNTLIHCRADSGDIGSSNTSRGFYLDDYVGYTNLIACQATNNDKNVHIDTQGANTGSGERLNAHNIIGGVFTSPDVSSIHIANGRVNIMNSFFAVEGSSTDCIDWDSTDGGVVLGCVFEEMFSGSGDGDVIDFASSSVDNAVARFSNFQKSNIHADNLFVDNKDVQSHTIQDISGPGAVNLTTETTHIVTTGTDAFTLADGYAGQQKFIVMQTDGGAGTLTPSNLANGSTITFDDVGDSAHLLFTNGSWHFMGGTATLA